MITRYLAPAAGAFCFPTLPVLPGILSMAQGIIPGGQGGWTVEVHSLPTYCYAVRSTGTQGRQARQVSIQKLKKASGSLQGPLLPLTHTTFLTHAGGHLLLETR